MPKGASWLGGMGTTLPVPSLSAVTSFSSFPTQDMPQGHTDSSSFSSATCNAPCMRKMTEGRQQPWAQVAFPYLYSAPWKGVSRFSPPREWGIQRGVD